MVKLHTLYRFFIKKDEQLRFKLLKRLAHYLVPRYRLTWPQLEWWEDEAFNRYLAKYGEQDGLNTHRRWALFQLTRLVSDVPGDTVECGAFEGAGSELICMGTGSDQYERVHCVFDSFEGLSSPSRVDGVYWSEGDMSSSEELLKGNLSHVESIEVYKGLIPFRFSEVEDRFFSFVHIDVDLYQPTLDSIEFFYPRMSDGAVLVCDDYGFTSCPGATKAIEQYLEDKPEKMVSLSTGGGFFIKGKRVSP
jgi:hypothetical protein